ncbi:unnamed protein product [Nesidiocoris tenuis]|uniref:Uncharacterized protein n=1 Tax=Nesidiocoris tenuis TaxID=355587 RepID=A0A6H5GBJ0_9HEMI|nr:unnamed protein product [Nesidiocoris tenuis]
MFEVLKMGRMSLGVLAATVVLVATANAASLAKAVMHPAFANAGSKAGLQIWRIQDEVAKFFADLGSGSQDQVPNAPAKDDDLEFEQQIEPAISKPARVAKLCCVVANPVISKMQNFSKKSKWKYCDRPKIENRNGASEKTFSYTHLLRITSRTISIYLVKKVNRLTKWRPVDKHEVPAFRYVFSILFFSGHKNEPI